MPEVEEVEEEATEGEEAEDEGEAAEPEVKVEEEVFIDAEAPVHVNPSAATVNRDTQAIIRTDGLEYGE